MNDLLVRNANFDFENSAPQQILAHGLDGVDRDCLLMAIAHEVDDIADGGSIFLERES